MVVCIHFCGSCALKFPSLNSTVTLVTAFSIVTTFSLYHFYSTTREVGIQILKVEEEAGDSFYERNSSKIYAVADRKTHTQDDPVPYISLSMFLCLIDSKHKNFV